MDQTGTAMQSGTLNGSTEKLSRILRKVTIASIYLVAFLAPLFYLPVTAEPLFGKEVLVVLLTAAALLAWLIRVLVTKEIRYHYSIVLAASGILLAVLFFAALFSIAPSQSFFAPDISGEGFASWASLIILSFLIAAEFSEKDFTRLMGVLAASGVILAFLIFFQITPFISLPQILQINPVGSLNNSAAVMAAFFLLGLGFLIFPEGDSRYWKIAALLLVITATIDMLLIDFKMGWLGLAAFSVLFIALYSTRSLRNNSNPDAHPTISANLIFAILLVVSIALVIFSLPLGRLVPNLKTEIEVRPSIQTTLSIGQAVLKTRPVLGSGPGTFVYDYDRFHSAAVNQTVFWNAKFAHGFSFLSTEVATLGTLGVLALLFFIITLFYILVKIVLRMERFSPQGFGMISMVIFGVVLWMMYPPTLTMNVVIFIAIGAVTSLATGGTEAASPLLRFEERIFKIKNQLTAFVSSLVALVVIIFILLAVFYFMKKYVAEIYFLRGNFEFVQNGNADTALARYASALALDPANDRYLVNKSQVYLARAQQALNRAIAGNTDAQATFRDNLNAAIESARQAAAAAPNDSGNWLNLGATYETAMPFVDGADRFAVAAYEEAGQHEPANPIPATFLGRTYLELADLLDIRARQNPSSTAAAAQLKKSALENAKQNFEKAVALKSDYATAEFLLAQAFTREGNIDEAIRRGAQAALSAPNDVGVAFFLGFLFYQKGDLVDAEQQFSRAVLINPNYANAMYFLGLIYDKTKRPGEALKQFRRIAELNPDNDEVKRIIANLEAGRQALAAITPPPEKRKGPPIKEPKPRKTNGGVEPHQEYRF